MNKRIPYLDYLRGFAIIMVLALHCISDYMVRADLFGSVSWYAYLVLNALARTGVPIFLMISGCLILSSEKTDDFAVFYKKRLLHLAIPLVFWNIAYFIFKSVFGSAGFDVRLLLADLINCGTEYHLWYLYTLIGIYLFAPFLRLIVKNCTIKQLCGLLALMLLCSSIRPFINTVTPEGVYVFLFEPMFNGYVALFLMGYILSKVEYSPKMVVIFASVALFGFAGSLILNHVSSSPEAVIFPANGGYSLCHYALAAGIFVLFKFIFAKKTLLYPIVSNLSKCSFGIYLVHVAVIKGILSFIMIDASPIVSSAYIFAVSLPISWAMSYIIGKIKYLNKTVL